MSYDTVKQKINGIKDEVKDGANTANRVGVAILETLDYAKENVETLNADMETIKTDVVGKVDTLSLDLMSLIAKAEISVSPANIYKGGTSTVKVTASYKGEPVARITIQRYVGGEWTDVQSEDNVTELSITTEKLTSSAQYRGLVLIKEGSDTTTATSTINAYNAVYYGYIEKAKATSSAFTADVAKTFISASTTKKLGATSSAKTTYNVSNPLSGLANLVILVPSGVTAPTKFAMVVPFGMQPSFSLTVNSVAYTVFISQEAYPSGQNLNVTAS